MRRRWQLDDDSGSKMDQARRPVSYKQKKEEKKILDRANTESPSSINFSPVPVHQLQRDDRLKFDYVAFSSLAPMDVLVLCEC